MDPCEKGDSFLSENFINQHIFITGSGKGKTNMWLHRLRKRRNPVVYEEISDPEEDDCVSDLSYHALPVRNCSYRIGIPSVIPSPKIVPLPKPLEYSIEAK